MSGPGVPWATGAFGFFKPHTDGTASGGSPRDSQSHSYKLTGSLGPPEQSRGVGTPSEFISGKMQAYSTSTGRTCAGTVPAPPTSVLVSQSHPLIGSGVGSAPGAGTPAAGTTGIVAPVELVRPSVGELGSKASIIWGSIPV